MSVQEEDASEDINSLSREELGRVIGSRWTGKKPEHHDEDAGTAKNYDDDGDEEYDETSDNGHDEEYGGSDSEAEDDHPKYEDDDTEDPINSGGDGANDDSHKYESDDEIDMSGTQLFL